MIRALIALIGMLALATSFAWSTPPGHAASEQRPTDDTAGPPGVAAPNTVVRLVDHTDVVTAGTFSIAASVATHVPLDDAEVALTVYGPIRTRSDFLDTLEDRVSGAIVILERRPLAEVLGPDGVVRLDIDVDDPTQRRTFLREAGVYPVRFDVRASGPGTVLGRFVTHLINQPPASVPPPDSRLAIAAILPIERPPDDAADPLAPIDTGPLTTLADSLVSRPQLPVTLLPRAETLEQPPDGSPDPAVPIAERLAIALGTRGVVRSTYAPVGAPLWEAELRGELDRQFERNEPILSAFGAVDTRTWVATEPLSREALAGLSQRGVQRLVVPERALAPIRRDTTLARPFTLGGAPSTASMPAVQADESLGAHFVDPAGPTLGAHRLLADLAVLWADRPGQSRGVVVMPPPGWVPEAPFLDVLFRGLESHPLARPTELDAIFALPIEGGRPGLVRALVAPPRNEPRFPTEQLLTARRRLTGLSGMVQAQNPTVGTLERRLLAAASARLDPKRRESALDAFERAVDEELADIRLPDERSVRLTSRTGEIPVSVQNDTGYPIRVVLRISADKVDFPAGAERVLEVDRQFVTERFAVDARTSGAFPVQVRLESPDGSIVLDRTRITVRSTAASGVGVALSVGAIAFLVVWWLRSVVRDRRRDRGARAT